MNENQEVFSAVVADDEPLAVERLRSLISGVPWLFCAGVAMSGPAAVEIVDELRPDLLFLDVKMPGLTGVQVVDRIRHQPQIVFTTAYDRYAVTAFELQALDYLLKPFGERRFKQVAQRVRDHLVRSRDHFGRDPAPHVSSGRSPTRLFVRERGRIVPVDVASIHRFEAHGDYVMIHTGKRKHLAHVRMKDLEDLMGPDRFLRIHRKHLVSADRIAELRPYDGHRLLVIMRNGDELLASRARSKALRASAV